VEHPVAAGQIVILNGAPRAGKSSIVAAIQDRFDGVWMNLGNDAFIKYVTPRRYQPGVGLRPGGERPDIEQLLGALFAAMYESIAAHSRLGLNVVADVDHHDSYSQPLHLLANCARRLAGLPVLFVGVRCPLEVVMARRLESGQRPGNAHPSRLPPDDVPAPVRLWQREVHIPGIYDLEVDTSLLTPEECAEAIRRRLHAGAGTAFARLADGH